MAEERNFRKVRRGYVVSDKMDKTITVELELVLPIYRGIVVAHNAPVNGEPCRTLLTWRAR